MSLVNIFKISYYFDNFTGYNLPGFWVVLSFLIILLFLALISGAKLNKNKKLPPSRKLLINGWINLGYLLSIVGLCLLFFRYQSIPYFNWRIWPTALLITAIVRAVSLIYYQKKLLPKKDAERQAKISQQYYFKRRKRK